MSYTTEGRLTITSTDGDPSEISELLNTAPDRTWRREDIRALSNLRFEHSGWSIVEEAGPPFTVEDVLWRLLKRTPFLQGATVPNNWSIEFSLSVDATDSAPECHLSSGLLVVLAALGADIDIDFLGPS